MQLPAIALFQVLVFVRRRGGSKRDRRAVRWVFHVAGAERIVQRREAWAGRLLAFGGFHGGRSSTLAVARRSAFPIHGHIPGSMTSKIAEA